MPVLTIRLSTELHERFTAECLKRDTTPSELGRRAIEAIVDHMIDQPMTSLQIVKQAHRRLISSGVRGFALDGSPLTTKASDRLKKEKK